MMPWFEQPEILLFHTRSGSSPLHPQSLGAAKQYVLGMMTPALLYQLMEKSYPLVSRGATISAQKTGPQHR